MYMVPQMRAADNHMHIAEIENEKTKSTLDIRCPERATTAHDDFMNS